MQDDQSNNIKNSALLQCDLVLHVASNVELDSCQICLLQFKNSLEPRCGPQNRQIELEDG